VRPQLEPDAAMRLDCGAGLGSVTQVTGTFAFAAVSRVVARILGKK
jgi:tRNA A37 threonylcarbamoyladenosine dehydratase